MIDWWYSRFSAEIPSLVHEVISRRSFSQGYLVEELEDQLASALEFKRCICVTSGTSALLLSFISVGVKPGSQVVVPDRTWVATSHAARILGADVVVAPVNERFLIEVDQLSHLINIKTSCVTPVFMNGRLFEPSTLVESIPSNIPLVYDCAQAFGSQLKGKRHLAEAIDIGAYSLSVAKTISSGQGGFIGVNDDSVAQEIASLRTHGLENVLEPSAWPNLGFNFRMTDLTAAVGLANLRLFSAKSNGLIHTYKLYTERLNHLSPSIQIIPVDIQSGELPQYVEAYSEYAPALRSFLSFSGIHTRGFFPPISTAPYTSTSIPEQYKFNHERYFILPCGPDRSEEDIISVCRAVESFFDTHHG